jgi:hypothetical protein
MYFVFIADNLKTSRNKNQNVVASSRAESLKQSNHVKMHSYLTS